MSVRSRIVTFLSIVLVGLSCSDVRPAQRPPDLTPRPSAVPLPAGQPARPGDPCTPKGATAHTQTGAEVTCTVYGGADHPRWKG